MAENTCKMHIYYNKLRFIDTVDTMNARTYIYFKCHAYVYKVLETLLK